MWLKILQKRDVTKCCGTFSAKPKKYAAVLSYDYRKNLHKPTLHFPAWPSLMQMHDCKLSLITAMQCHASGCDKLESY